MKPIISIIIPVHNGAKKIQKTSEQILQQDFRELELILVENGSTDNSAQVCDKLAQHDNRVIVLHNGRSGTSLARRAGALQARGQWILFSDDDDEYISNSSIREMVEIAELNRADICQFGHYIKRAGFMKRVIKSSDRVINRDELFADDIAGVLGAYQGTITTVLWDKVFSAHVMKNAVDTISANLGSVTFSMG